MIKKIGDCSTVAGFQQNDAVVQRHYAKRRKETQRDAKRRKETQ